MLRRAAIFAFTLALSLAAACEDRTGFSDPRQVKVTTLTRDLDILFVIDNSGSMAEEQASLQANFAGFMNVLETANVRSVHIGVISTDVGAGPYNITACAGVGDDGRLQNTARQSQCTPPTGAFIDDPDLSCTSGCGRNYTDTLANTFSCIAALGVEGCGFEQPLESMRRALIRDSTEELDPFERESAMLAVVFITDEDDCSVSDTELFTTEQTSIDSPLGPLTSFRCFEFGVRCEPDEPRMGGAKSSCAPRADSPYMPDVAEYADFLKATKSDPNRIFVAAVIGDPTPVTVGVDMFDNPTLEPSCQSTAGEADPAVRLAGFASSFPGRNAIETICNADLSGALTAVANALSASVNESFEASCLPGQIFDTDTSISGVQASCTVEQTSPGVASRNIDSCFETAGARPCFRVTEDPVACPNTETNLVLRVDRDTAPPSGTSVEASCFALETSETRSPYDCSASGRGGPIAVLVALLILLGRRRATSATARRPSARRSC